MTLTMKKLQIAIKKIIHFFSFSILLNAKTFGFIFILNRNCDNLLGPPYNVYVVIFYVPKSLIKISKKEDFWFLKSLIYEFIPPWLSRVHATALIKATLAWRFSKKLRTCQIQMCVLIQCVSESIWVHYQPSYR